MDRIDQYRVFARVVDMGGFTRAADALALPRATVSAAIAQLEARLGVRLLHRTTRQVRPSSDGLRLLERIRPLLAEVEDVERLFEPEERAVSGRLMVDAPGRIAHRLIAPALPELLRRHPGLEVALGSADRTIDLVREGVDCAIRVGTPRDGGVVAQPLGHFALVNCASPDYLRTHGTPRTPEDLRHGHIAVGYAGPSNGREQPWDYLDGEGVEQVLALPGQVAVNGTESYIACALAGLGLIQVPRYDVQDLLAAGALVEVLAAYRAAPMPVSLLFPHRRHRPRRVLAFQAWFRALVAPHLEA